MSSETDPLLRVVEPSAPNLDPDPDPEMEEPSAPYLYPDPDAERYMTCTCNKEIRLEAKEWETWQEGDHIIRPLKCCCFGKLHLCFHHAILMAKISKDDVNETENTVKFNFAGFSESNENKAEIQCQLSETLSFKEMDIYKIDYNYAKYRGEHVIKNMKDLKENGIPYHIFLNNCEHACRGCVTGEEKSIQVDTLDNCCTKSVFGLLPRLFRLLLVILSAIPDNFYPNNIGWITGMESFFLTVYFYMILREVINSKFRYDAGKMCKKCLRRSRRCFLTAIIFILVAVAVIILEALCSNRKLPWCTTDKYICWFTSCTTLITLLLWFIIELCNVCSERFCRIATRCLCCCIICTCCSCCLTKCYNERCSECSKCCQKCSLKGFDKRWCPRLEGCCLCLGDLCLTLGSCLKESCCPFLEKCRSSGTKEVLCQHTFTQSNESNI